MAKWSKGYVPYLYTWIKYKIATVCIKNKTGKGDWIIVSPKNRQNKDKQRWMR